MAGCLDSVEPIRKDTGCLDQQGYLFWNPNTKILERCPLNCAERNNDDSEPIIKIVSAYSKIADHISP